MSRRRAKQQQLNALMKRVRHNIPWNMARLPPFVVIDEATMLKRMPNLVVSVPPAKSNIRWMKGEIEITSSDGTVIYSGKGEFTMEDKARIAKHALGADRFLLASVNVDGVDGFDPESIKHPITVPLKEIKR